MQPLLHADPDDTRGLAELLDLSADYALMRPSLLAALGVTDDDLRLWEAASAGPPRIDSVVMPPDDDGDFDVAGPRGGETEFILDDPDEEDADDEDAEKPETDEDSDEDEDDSDDDDEDDDDDDDAEDADDDDTEEGDDVDDDEDGGGLR